MKNGRALCGVLVTCVLAFSVGGFAGCKKDGGANKSTTTANKSTGEAGGGTKPVFTLAWSEYPSWSLFDVASSIGLINGEAGKLGPIEEKWGVDIELKLLEYDACMDLYKARKCDAVCITNLDVLSPANSVKSVAIIPTSTSVGADACIVTNIDVPGQKDPMYKEKMKEALKKLRAEKVYGLKESVSEYTFIRNLELWGEKEDDYKFTKLDPDVAAKNMQSKVADTNAIMVWNPFVLQTLKVRKDAKVLFDSSSIPEEIIDMVVVSAEALKKPGGKEFACAVIDVYYQFNKKLTEPGKRDELLVALGAKFSKLDLEEMKKATQQTRFFDTPEKGLELFTGKKFPETMKNVLSFYDKHKFVERIPEIGFGTAEQAKDARLRFDPSYIQMVKDKK